MCPLCDVSETTHHIIFTCPAAGFLWSFISEALAREWQALDQDECLEEHANRAGRRRLLFWLVFATMSWTLWTIYDKLVIERRFSRREFDSMFKFLAFLQQWHLLGSGTNNLD
jgi:hypothetical protein